MAKKKEIKQAQENNILLESVVKGMEELKALDITIIDLRKLKNSVADYFVICSGNSDSHIDSIAGEVEKQVYLDTKQNPWRKEGKQNREWILIDYVDIVAHVFKKDKRELFALEDLWGDGVLIFPSNGEQQVTVEQKKISKSASTTKTTPKTSSSKAKPKTSSKTAQVDKSISPKIKASEKVKKQTKSTTASKSKSVSSSSKNKAVVAKKTSAKPNPKK